MNARPLPVASTALLDVEALECATPNAAANNAGLVIDFGVSDVEPAMFAGELLVLGEQLQADGIDTHRRQVLADKGAQAQRRGQGRRLWVTSG